MDLRDIVLTSLDEAEFPRMHHFWYNGKTRYPAEDYSHVRMVRPISYPSYETLIVDFIQHPEADSISVNNNGRWEQRFVRDVWDTHIRRFSKIAENDRYKRGTVELYFCRDDTDFPRIVLRFAQRDHAVFSYEVITNPLYAGFFTWQTAERPSADKDIYCLWAPEVKVVEKNWSVRIPDDMV